MEDDGRMRLNSIQDNAHFCICISSFGSAKTSPHFSHLETCRGSYIGIMTLTLASGEGCSTNILFTGIRFQ